jgi:hypothetical protein
MLDFSLYYQHGKNNINCEEEISGLSKDNRTSHAAQELNRAIFPAKALL